MAKALCDSGAIINMMPLFVVKRLNLGELTPITMTLQMADRTLAQLEGIFEDMLIKVGKFIFPADFVVINIEEDKQLSLLLGKPFLATRAALIDVKKGELTQREGDEAVLFNLNQSLKQLEFDNVDCKTVEIIVPISSELKYDYRIQSSMNENEKNFQYIEDLDVEFLNSSCEIKETILSLNEGNAEKSSGCEGKAQEVETSFKGLILKELPKYLKYAFLGAEKSKPVIIAANLTKERELKLIKILIKYREAIAWSMEDLKGINPLVCMHKILLEENAKHPLNTRED